INEAISKPQGMIINTGPTGSGKTTTLYAILQKLNEPGKKIITMEDPIEYRVKGIEQVQINADKDAVSEKTQTSFLDALKGCMRQDPDILMIGEIRDKETAHTALQAAMTGHLVLTTLHTNNAPTALARLVDMGIEPYLLAGSINLIIAQRLVRVFCPDCQGKGCEICHESGLHGRTAIIEVLEPGAEIEKLIRDKAPLRDFESTAHKLGMRTMHEDGMDKVSQGLTTKEEVERVMKE
ncbi:MAG: gspE, partial [Candidatus Berkelbacteria bacterium]|nr:gspE [Candidatus Berkelbacteria bacterium]